MSYGPPVKTKTITILNGQTTSPAFDLEGMELSAIGWPAAWDGGTPTVTFLVAPTATGTYNGLVDEAGAAISVTVVASKVTGLDNAAREMRAVRFAKIVASASQTADRVITLYLDQVSGA